MFALYRFVDVPGGKRRRLRLTSVYNSQDELLDFIDAQKDIKPYKVELMNHDNANKISAKKVREIIIRNRLQEQGYPRHEYSGVLFNGDVIVPVDKSEITEDYVVPEGHQFGLITYRYGIEDGIIILKAVNSRIADTESIANTLRRERENQQLALGGFDSPIEDYDGDEEDEDVMDDVLVE